MSPEQATAEKEISARSDVYSLASVLYEMLTGNPPHTGSSAQQIIMKIITEQPQPVTQLRNSVPNNVAAAIAKALEKLPADRFESAAKFANALANSSFTTRDGGSSPLTHAGTSRWKAIAIGMSVVALGAVVVAAIASQRDTTPKTQPGVVRFEISGASDQRIVTSISAPFGISPDGRTIVYTATDSIGISSLFVRALDDPAPRRLLGTEDGTHPVVSPDGEWIAYVSGNRLLSKVRLTGGTPRVLAELPGVSASLSWISNDEILAEVIAPSEAMHRVSANGGTAAIAVPFDTAANEQRQRRPLVLRESQMVLYTGTRRNDSSEIVMYSLRDGRRARLAISGAPLAVIDERLVYANAGALRAVGIDVKAMKILGDEVQLSQRASHGTTGTAAGVSEAGTLVYEDPVEASSSRLELVDFSGVRTTLRADDRYGAPRFSPDGRRIAVAIRTVSTSQAIALSSDVWVIDVATREAVRLTNGGAAYAPEWSPDQKRIIYITYDGGQRGVWSAALDGSSTPSRVVEEVGDFVSAVPTPDGQSLIASRWGRGDSRLELLRYSLTGTSHVDTLVSPHGPNDVRPISPRVSPDGRLVAFADRSLRSVHVRALNGPGELQISTNGGCCPLWAPDSRRVYFRDGDKLVAVDLDVASGLSLSKRTISTGFWSVGSTAFNNYDAIHYDLSPSGRAFVIATPANAASRVFVAFNWAEELRREFSTGGR
jgi:serine/threonine-protein kinase